MEQRKIVTEMYGGCYTTTTEALELILNRYEGYKTKQLQQVLEQITDMDYAYHNRAECLLILADFEYATLCNEREVASRTCEECGHYIGNEGHAEDCPHQEPEDEG
jgi:hypothetical protein